MADLLVSGRARTLDEAEEIYLDEHLHELVSLVESPLSDHDCRRNLLMGA